MYNMPRQPSAEHGTPGRYRRGCRCAECSAAERERTRAWRLRKANGSPQQPADDTTVVTFPSKVSHQATKPLIGPCERAVIDQISQSAYADSQPATCQQAYALARIIDNSGAAGMHTTASRQLQTLLLSLNPSKPKRQKGRLAVVSKMTSGQVAQ